LVESLLEEVQKMLNVLIRKLRTKDSNLKAKSHNLKPNSGLTLIELLVTLGLIATIGATTFLYLGRYRNIKDLERSSDELLAVVQATQKRSITQEDGKRWGIRFVNPASGPDYYDVFKGLSYAVGTVSRTHYFRRGAYLLNPATSTIDITFDPISGKPTQSQVISLGLTGAAGYLTDIFVNASSGFSNYRLEQGLVGYWHFDEGTSTLAYDASGNSNTGTLANGPTWQTGSNCEAGACLNFNSGSNQMVNVGNPAVLQISGPFTITVWVKPASISGILGIVTKEGSWTGYSLSIESNKFRFFTTANSQAYSIFSATTPTIGTWYHIAGVFDGQKNYIYVNGVKENETSASMAANVNNNFIIGYGGYWPGGYFSGVIDEVRIYNRALSASEIKAIYNDLK
jgi:type II secretory pathway pseudopilin PulG